MTEPVKIEEPETLQQEDEQPPGRSLSRIRRWPVAAMVLVTVLFFALSLGQSLRATWNSDTASVALQGWDMVHGHLLLHGWWSSDVNFYTFDAPIYGLCLLVLGLGSTGMHVAAALIYTLVFLSACWLVKGHSHGAVYWFRVALVALLTTTVLFQGALIGTVMLVPDHNGTIVFVLVAYVLYSRFATRRWTPWVLLVLLTLGQLGDVSIRYVTVPSVLLVWAVDSLRTRRLRTPETWLALATAGSVVLSYALRAVMKHLGAYYLTPARATIAPRSQWGWRFTGTWESLLSLFGVPAYGFPGSTGTQYALTCLGGLSLVCGVLSLLAALIFWTKVDAADRLLAVTCLAYLGAYEFSTVGEPGGGGGYEFVGVIAMFAVLSARMISNLPPLRVPAARTVTTAVASLGAVILLLSGTSSFRPTQHDPLQPLAAWLQGHNLTYGLAGYWNSAPITVYSGGKVKVRQMYVQQKGFLPQTWGANAQWYVPTQNDARFVIAEDGAQGALTAAQAESAFGKPAALYHVGPYTVLVYDYNLLTTAIKPVVAPGD